MTSPFPSIPSSEARQGEMVTTINRLDGVGIGYLVNDVVYKTTGSYWAIPAEDDVFGIKRIVRDGGQSYRAMARKMMGA